MKKYRNMTGIDSLPGNRYEERKAFHTTDTLWRKLALIGVMAGFCVSLMGCNTMLGGDYSLKYVVDSTKEPEEEFSIDIPTIDDMITDTDKYTSDYPDAFVFLEKHSTDTKDLISFEILDYIDGNTFVYSYQTLVKTDSSNSLKSKTMASVLMSYNYQTKTKNIIWELTSSVTESKSFFAQPIYKALNANSSNAQCIGYLAYFNGQICIYDKKDSKVLFKKNISGNLEKFFNKNRSKSDSATYEISGVTVDGDFDSQLNLNINMVIMNKNIDEALEGEAVPTVTYAPDNLEEGEDEDISKDDYGIKGYSLLYTIVSMGKMTFTTKNTNYENMVSTWTNSGSYGQYSNSYGDCIMSNGLTLLEENNSYWTQPRCAAGNMSEIAIFSEYSHILRKNNKDYYEIYGAIEKIEQKYIEHTRTAKTTDGDGKEVEVTVTAKFLYSNTFTFANDVYGISCSYTQDNSDYAYLYGNYILKYKDNELSVLYSARSGVDQYDIYNIKYKVQTESNISVAEGILIDGSYYIFLSDDKYLYIYDTSGFLIIKIPVSKLYFNRHHIKTSEAQTEEEQIINPNIYRARDIKKIGAQYYIASVFNGLTTVDTSASIVQHVAEDSCYGIYSQGSSHMVLGYDNNKFAYMMNDIIHAKCIPISVFQSR